MHTYILKINILLNNIQFNFIFTLLLCYW